MAVGCLYAFHMYATNNGIPYPATPTRTKVQHQMIGIYQQNISLQIFIIYITKTFPGGVSNQSGAISITMPFKPLFDTTISARLMVANTQVGVGRALFMKDGSITGSWNGYGSAVTILVYGYVYLN